MKLINTGASRIVILLGQYAVKIPRIIKPRCHFYGKLITFLQGWKANRAEYLWSKENIFPFLCAVKWSFLFSIVIVMKKASPITQEEYNKLNMFNFGYEHKLDSYGKVKGKIVVVDYG